MRIAVGSDERTHLTGLIIAVLADRGHETVLFGALARVEAGQEDGTDWPIVSRQVAESVASGDCAEGIVFCWTGTGASIAANKVPGIRAALCQDAETARGARIWNHANVLALSLRSTGEGVAREILDAWFATPWSEDEWNIRQIARIRDTEKRHGRRTEEPG
jgi:ribose 5-phosphate isomerase B